MGGILAIAIVMWLVEMGAAFLHSQVVGTHLMVKLTLDRLIYYIQHGNHIVHGVARHCLSTAT